MNANRRKSSSSPNRLPLVWLALLVIAPLIAFSTSFRGTFVFDDCNQILSHDFSNAFGPNLFLASRPVGYFSFAVNHLLHGTEVWGYHFVNLVIHLISGGLLFWLLRRLLSIGFPATNETSPTTPRSANEVTSFSALTDGLALVATLWWLVHPLQTQSVTYIIQRYESLAGMFYLACVVSFFVARDNRQWGWYLVSISACWLGMWTKEILLTAPWLILAFDRVLFKESWRELFRQRGWYYALLFASILAVVNVSSIFRLAESPAVTSSSTTSPDPFEKNRTVLKVEGISTWDYARSQPVVICHYLKLAFWPRGLCLDYAWPVENRWSRIIPAAILILGLVTLTAVFWWKGYVGSLLGVWFFFILATTSSVLVIRDLAMEHRMYLPLATLTTMAAIAGHFGITAIARQLRWSNTNCTNAKLVAATIITLALISVTMLRNLDYHSRLGMWQDVAKKAPHNGRAYVNIGGVYYLNGQLDEAMSQLTRGLELTPDDEYGRMSLAKLFLETDRISDAWPHIRFLQNSTNFQAWGYTLAAEALRAENQLEEAEKSLQTATKLDPKLPNVKFEYARLMMRLKRFDEAEKYLKEGLSLDPGNAYGYNLFGVFGLMINRPDLAERAFRAAISLAPENQTYQQNLAQVIAAQQRKPSGK